MNKRPVIAVTCGEPAGVGPEIALRACWALREQVCSVLIGDAAFLALLAADIDPAITLKALSWEALQHQGLPDFGNEVLTVIDCPLVAPVMPGTLDPRNGRAVLQSLDVAIAGARQNTF